MKRLKSKFIILFGFLRMYRIWWQDQLLKLVIRPVSGSKTILITKMDAIGDYILFRNYLPYIKKSERFKDCKVVLVGNILWKTIAEKFDADFVDEFVWIDRTRFRREVKYRWQILKKVRSLKYTYSGDFVYSREVMYGDAVNRVADSPKKMAWFGDINNTSLYWKRKADRVYHELVHQEDILFEFDKNKIIVEQFIGENLDEHIPLTFGLRKPKPEPRVVVFPGASDAGKQWSTDNFAQVVLYLTGLNPKLKIIICGSEGEKHLGYKLKQQLIGHLKEDQVIDLTGKTTLIQLIALINESALLLSNDTSSVHIAASCTTTTICIAHGRHLGRFVPYPNHISENIYCIFPFIIYSDPKDFKKQQIAMIYQPVYNVNEISPGQVIEFIKKSNIIV